ncbi:hypothetical protein PUN28_011740 [Cardiocondyla obscurior]|uniref:Uncharacterized protein n=1 Tax=Cardiocondyla obscurior TaxID=286306 RepID=A0AAW2FIP5_9HYME
MQKLRSIVQNVIIINTYHTHLIHALMSIMLRSRLLIIEREITQLMKRVEYLYLPFDVHYFNKSLDMKQKLEINNKLSKKDSDLLIVSK